MTKLCPFYWTLLKTDFDENSNTSSTRDRSEFFLLFSLSFFFLSFFSLSFFSLFFSTLFPLFLWWMVELGSGWDDVAAAALTNVNRTRNSKGLDTKTRNSTRQRNR